jgi:hypothetical protein
MTTTRQRFTPVRLDTPHDFLLALMQKHEIRSYEQAAAFLVVKRQTVYNYRDNETGFSADVSRKVADALEIPEEFVLARMAEFRAASDAERAAWRRASEAIRGAMREAASKGFKLLAGVAIGAAAVSAPPPASAAPSPAQPAETLCIMSTLQCAE